MTSASNQSPVAGDRPSKAGTLIAAAATALLAVVSIFALIIAGLTSMATNYCDDTQLNHVVCTQVGFWWATFGLLCLAFGGLGVAVFGTWIWPRRARWAWIGAGYLMAFAGYVTSFTISNTAPR